MCPQPEVFCPKAEAGNEFSPAERNLLIQIAHKAILAQLDGAKISSDAPTSHLTEPRGVFTTVYVDGSLRGCVGNIAPKNSLYEAVIETARSAAFEDSRFPPLSREEAAKIEITLSVLSPLELIDTEKIEVGKHGLLVSQGSHRGLLLPQVASEQGWDRLTFLEHACRKAGLPVDAWKTGVRIEAFTAEVFADREQKRSGEANFSPVQSSLKV
ncbi:MAG: AmmeMemoRadiSam system protein A [Acidobacteriaceae bacterium]